MLNGVSRIYGGVSERPIGLAPQSLEVAAGALAVIVGRSGSGKTTLLNLIGGLDAPTTGTVEVLGEPVPVVGRDRRAAAWRAATIGFVFQGDALLVNLSIAENLGVALGLAGPRALDGREVESGRIATTLAEVGLAEFADHRPGELSGGQRRRAALARALVTGPALILADEPTAGLDRHAAGDIIALLARVADGGTTVIVATHDPDLADAAAMTVTLR